MKASHTLTSKNDVVLTGQAETYQGRCGLRQRVGCSKRAHSVFYEVCHIPRRQECALKPLLTSATTTPVFLLLLVSSLLPSCLKHD
eukprot:scaffold35473_cov18-Tisochrysis_lutea.AAC.1